MRKYKVYDLYEGRTTLGYADTMAEVRQIARKQAEDTDDECFCVYAELNPRTNKYNIFEEEIIYI